jgi:triacylglycerol lipase
LVAENSDQAKITVLVNQQYGSTNEVADLCDIYLPASQPNAAGHAVVILVPGGAWISGDKSQVERYARSLAENGCAAIAINYALAPRHKFPAQVDSVRQAMCWTKGNAARFEIDISNLGLFGYSAGGHLVTLLAALADETMEVRSATSHWTKEDRRWRQLPRIRAVCAGAPPTDFRQVELDHPAFTFLFGHTRRANPDRYNAASPAAHVSGGDPATLIFHGNLDVVVPCSASKRFHRAQQAVGIDSQLNVMQNRGHVTTFLDDVAIRKTVDFFDDAFGLSLAATTSKYR